MSVYGEYDPTQSGNASSLFLYKEVPVTSTKMNRWNGNIEAGFALLHAVCSTLFARGENAVISNADADALGVVEADEPNMSVRVNPGWAIVVSGFAGLGQESILPDQGNFIAPATHDRIDKIALSSSGELVVVEGAEAETPIAPDAPVGAITLALIYHRPGANQVLNEDNESDSYIIDARPRFAHGDAHRHSTDSAPNEAPDGERTQFSTQDYFRSGSLQVFLNGVLQKSGVDFNEDESSVSYQFISAPPTGALLTHHYIIDRVSG
ncbi:phage baseplate assembly protein V [bacterium]|nr:phage baseplate assembly protein V [bacterium]